MREAIAKQSLERLAQDPAAHRLAREHADGIKLYEMDMASYRKKVREEGVAEGQANLLIKQLELRFGPLAEAMCTRVRSASAELLDTWAERVLTAPTLDDVLAP
jgi:hypothetical protein